MRRIMQTALALLILLVSASSPSFAEQTTIHAYCIWVGQWLQVDKSFLSDYTGPVMLRIGEACLVIESDDVKVIEEGLHTEVDENGVVRIMNGTTLIGISCKMNRMLTIKYDLSSVASVHIQFVSEAISEICSIMNSLKYVTIDEFYMSEVVLLGEIETLKGLFPTTGNDFRVAYLDARIVIERELFKNCIYLPLEFVTVAEVEEYYASNKRCSMNIRLIDPESALILPNHITQASIIFYGYRNADLMMINNGTSIRYLAINHSIPVNTSFDSIISGIENMCELKIAILSGTVTYQRNFAFNDRKNGYVVMNRIEKHSYDISCISTLKKLRMLSLESLGKITGLGGFVDSELECLYLADIELYETIRPFRALKKVFIMRCSNVSAVNIARIFASPLLESIYLIRTEIGEGCTKYEMGAIRKFRWIGCAINSDSETALLSQLARLETIRFIDISYSSVGLEIVDANIVFSCKVYAYYTEMSNEIRERIVSNEGKIYYKSRGEASSDNYDRSLLDIYIGRRMMFSCAIWQILGIGLVYPIYNYTVEFDYFVL